MTFDFDKWVEIFATLLSLVYLYLEIKEKKSLWLLGILSSALYVIIFFKSHFYADCGLSLYYVAISVYGWIHWGKRDNANELPISNLTLKTGVALFFATLLCYGLLLALLLYVPQYLGISSSSLPYVDSFTVAASITATWLLSQKVIDHWYMWMVINIISIVMFWVKGLHFTSALYAVYGIGSVLGYLSWKRSFERQTSGL